MPGARFAKLVALWNVPLFSWYSKPATALLTVIVPDGVTQVGCINVSVGTAGPAGGVFMVTLAEVAVHPDVFLTVTVYVPGVRPEKLGVVWNAPVFSWYSEPATALLTVMVPVVTVQVG